MDRYLLLSYFKRPIYLWITNYYHQLLLFLLIWFKVITLSGPYHSESIISSSIIWRTRVWSSTGTSRTRSSSRRRTSTTRARTTSTRPLSSAFPPTPIESCTSVTSHHLWRPFIMIGVTFCRPSIAGVAKVRPAGHMRPSKDFLRPLCQILDA